LEVVLLGIFSAIFAMAGIFLVSGMLEIPPWYGMSAGLVALTAAVAELRGGGLGEKGCQRGDDGRKGDADRPDGPTGTSRLLAWVGLVGGGGAALVGLALYGTAWIWAVQ
jgi:hypothetical protein